MGTRGGVGCEAESVGCLGGAAGALDALLVEDALRRIDRRVVGHAPHKLRCNLHRLLPLLTKSLPIRLLGLVLGSRRGGLLLL